MAVRCTWYELCHVLPTRQKTGSVLAILPNTMPEQEMGAVSESHSVVMN